MTRRGFTRRNFLKTASAGTVAATAGGPLVASANATKKLAIHGGERAHQGGWPGWPIWDKDGPRRRDGAWEIYEEPLSSAIPRNARPARRPVASECSTVACPLTDR
jgi:hypothetical protein